MEPKKISFGFSKITKKTNLLPSKENTKTENKVELIKCVEEHEIKLLEEKPAEHALIIPLKESHKTSAALASLIKRRAVLLGEEEPEDNNTTNERSSSNGDTNSNPKTEDLEKRAARELLADIQKNSSTDPTNNMVLTVVKPEDLPLDGANESTLDDYESIPIQDFGNAMLRGMGWTEPKVKTHNKDPIVRPKGMGLCADKALNKKPLLVAPEENEVLEVKRNAFVRILGGKHKDLYGQIQGFDDYAGRVIVKMAIGGGKEAFNEFLCQPVCKKEYNEYGKCINTKKYEEYKKKDNECGQIVLNKDEKISIKEEKKERQNDDFKNNHRAEYRQDKKDFKRENDGDHHRRYKNENESKRDYDYKYSNRDEDKYRKKESNRDNGQDRECDTNRQEVRYSSREYNRAKDYQRPSNRDIERNQNRERQQDYNRYDTKSYRYNDFERSSTRGKERQQESDRGYQKTIQLTDSSDTENDKHSSKHKKSKKSKHSKKTSKTSKNTKSKYNSDTSSDTCSDSSSDSEDEKQRKYKKKTKKSKKHRERSRTRERR